VDRPGRYRRGLLAVFMLKALFFLKKSTAAAGMLITEHDQPRLFAFLHRLADEVGAQRPRRVYISPRVNAAVVYDLSIINLLLPRRRDLEIGLGLVNVLSLAEFKAVIAHEFAHFAQRSLLLGRWVDVGAQIAAHVVGARSALDSLLRGLTRVLSLNPLFFFLFAFGWILRLAVWAIRSVTDTAFRLLLMAQRALSRQMEFQADLVAVSVTGSDPLVQALHKLQAADAGWKWVLTFAGSELGRGHRVPELFQLQSFAIQGLRTVLGIPEFGLIPDPTDGARDSDRLFKARFVQPPQMWLTHPPSFEREENCKRRYVASKYNDISAWTVFENAEDLRERVTSMALKAEPRPLQSKEESLRALERSFDRPYLNRAYQGAYLGRPLARRVLDPHELYEAMPAEDAIATELAAVHPVSLRGDVELFRNLIEERNSLKALQSKTLAPTGGVVTFRGESLQRHELAAAITKVQSELDVVDERIAEHDRRCRSAHRAAAAILGGGWDDYLFGLGTLLHYAEHSEANIADARGYLGYVIAVVTNMGRINAKEVPLVVSAAEIVFSAIREAFEQSQAVVLDLPLGQRLGAALWPLRAIRFNLASPAHHNISAWLQGVDRWVSMCVGLFGQLHLAALDQLLTTEAMLADAYRNRTPLPDAPVPSAVPTDFRRRAPGMERERKLEFDWFDRWQLAAGPAAAASRWLVAAALLASISVFGLAVGGHGEANKQFNSGLAAQRGASGPADFALAVRWYRIAAAQGSAAAQNNLGVLYNEGRGVPKDAAQAYALFRQAALQDNPEAESNLGNAYLVGHGVAQDYALAYVWLSRAAAHGIAKAQVNLAWMYTKGLGIAPDPFSATQWYQRAATQGDVIAQTNLGLAYKNGVGVKRDEAKAATWFQSAATHGNPAAEFNLGWAYFNGAGVAKDAVKAVEWFRKAADQGDVGSQATLGLVYSGGFGVAKDATEAVQWFRKAADQGNAEAQTNLGIAYNTGAAGLKKDDAEAVGWYRKAAAQGLAVAQFNLALQYYRGRGVAADKPGAIDLLQKAADQGFEPARKVLRAIKTGPPQSRASD
jgi:TPR repeat protein/Zn-dependent protease with chaperone function